ncbi:response regulator [Flavobacterium ponti]|uniref:histidine kinase n=1 Tax=Flavobacterium ponti TaxID=665133 RepID=A0ABV9P3L1_9FLAO
MKKIVFLILIVFNCCFSQSNQVEFDKALKTSEQFLKNLQADSAYFYALKSETIANKSSDKLQLVKSYIALSNALYKQGKKNNSFTFAKKADSLAIASNNIELSLEAKLTLGNIYFSKFEDVKAIETYQTIEKIASKNNIENKSLVKALQNTGLLFLRGYQDQNKDPFESANAYFKKAYSIAEKNNLKEEQYIIGSYIGSVHVNNKEYEKALEYYDEAHSYFKKTNNIKELCQINWAYATLYRYWNKNSLAEKYYNENIQLNSNVNNINGIARAHWALAGYFVQKKQFSKAIIEYEKAIEFFKKEKNIDIGPYSSSLYELSLAYKKIGENDKAYKLLDEYVIYNDSLNSIQNREAFTEIETKYQNEKKEQEIKLLSAENKLAQKQKYIYIGLAILFLILGLSLFFVFRNKIKTAQKLKELNDLKSKFFANISHEFRTPLTLIKSPVQILQTTVKSDNEMKQLQLIDKNSNRMLELVDQLLELSKIDSGKLQLILKSGNIASFLHSIIEPFDFQAKNANINFKTSIEKKSENHNFDKDVIEKIVTNLVSNAFKYTAENENIVFSSNFENENLKLIVSNSGTTLKKEDLSKLFERFYQKNENAKGVGIGLALVKELVDLYEGTIQTKIEHGVLQFEITIPLAKTPVNAIIISSENEKPIINSIENDSELPILLIVDDNAEIRSILKSIFNEKFKTIEAEDGEKALKIALKEIPDCIISDVMMPKLDGFSFAKAIKSNELTSFIPVVLLTAKTSEEAHLEGLKSTADAFLTKPFNNEIVIETVNQLITERKKLHNRYSQELVLKPTEIVVDSYDEKFIHKLQTILDQNITNSDFTAEEFANQANVSRMQLHRKLKSLFGVSATEFIRNERIKMAAELLKKESIGISEVGYAVGFNDISYFAKCFKEVFELSPSEYHKKHSSE